MNNPNSKVFNVGKLILLMNFANIFNKLIYKTYFINQLYVINILY
jgi:hypothetical protein